MRRNVFQVDAPSISAASYSSLADSLVPGEVQDRVEPESIEENTTTIANNAVLRSDNQAWPSAGRVDERQDLTGPQDDVVDPADGAWNSCPHTIDTPITPATDGTK